MHAKAACVTVTLVPAIVSTVDRLVRLRFCCRSTVRFAVPLPVTDALAVPGGRRNCAQLTGELPVQPHPVAAVTTTVGLPASLAGNVVWLTVGTQAAPAWFTATE